MAKTKEKFVLINLKKEWKKISMHLYAPIVETALEAGMKAFCKDHAYIDRKEYNPEKGPWYYTPSDYWSMKRKPRVDSLGWYQCMGACHWLSGFACALGSLAYPKYNWKIAYSDIHSIAFGHDPDNDNIYIIDILGDRTLSKILTDVILHTDGHKETTLDKEIVDRLCEFRMAA